MTDLHIHPHFNYEEAAHAAAEYISSLDNLPAEIAFLTEEIKEKDIRITQLLNRIGSRHSGLTRQLKNPTPSSATFPLPLPLGAPIPVDHLSTKDAQNLGKIQTEWGKIEALQEEKVALAERMERIINRARERGRMEWIRVGGKDLDSLEDEDDKVGLGELGNSEVLLPPSGLGSGSDIRPQKKRKIHALPLPLPSSSYTTPIIHPPANSMPPPSIPHRPSMSARSTTRRHERHTSALSDIDMDDGNGGEGDGETETDDRLYCFCQQKSYGEMIGCDNDKCKYEWFHIKCVNVHTPVPDTWYCPDCVQKLGLSSSDGTVAGGQKEKKGRRR
ncbi:hypothetical protein M231_06572 [Tremella mesenterica]|uniref:Chromatin modification-related protein n=1 Tax=Tremella mesenterica TaxID=5217 RepID=A0A4Q1BDB5_TREME|nr:hypothetical protein M231_06572 [Tremella mesenterica]